MELLLAAALFLALSLLYRHYKQKTSADSAVIDQLNEELEDAKDEIRRLKVTYVSGDNVESKIDVREGDFRGDVVGGDKS